MNIKALGESERQAANEMWELARCLILDVGEMTPDDLCDVFGTARPVEILSNSNGATALERYRKWKNTVRAGDLCRDKETGKCILVQINDTSKGDIIILENANGTLVNRHCNNEEFNANYEKIHESLVVDGLKRRLDPEDLSLSYEKSIEWIFQKFCNKSEDGGFTEAQMSQITKGLGLREVMNLLRTQDYPALIEAYKKCKVGFFRGELIADKTTGERYVIQRTCLESIDVLGLRHLGENGPTYLSFSSIEISSGNYVRLCADFDISALYMYLQ